MPTEGYTENHNQFMQSETFRPDLLDGSFRGPSRVVKAYAH